MTAIALAIFILAIVYVMVWSIKNDHARSIGDQTGLIKMRNPSRAGHKTDGRKTASGKTAGRESADRKTAGRSGHSRQVSAAPPPEQANRGQAAGERPVSPIRERLSDDKSDW